MEAPIKAIPRRKVRMSYEEYLALPNEAIVEWVDGEVIFHTPPTTFHQSIKGLVSWLIVVYAQQLKLGRVLIAPFEVKLWPGGPSREPDILFVSHDKLLQLSDQRFNGPPD